MTTHYSILKPKALHFLRSFSFFYENRKLFLFHFIYIFSQFCIWRQNESTLESESAIISAEIKHFPKEIRTVSVRLGDLAMDQLNHTIYSNNVFLFVYLLCKQKSCFLVWLLIVGLSRTIGLRLCATTRKHWYQSLWSTTEHKSTVWPLQGCQKWSTFVREQGHWEFLQEGVIMVNLADYTLPKSDSNSSYFAILNDISI